MSTSGHHYDVDLPTDDGATLHLDVRGTGQPLLLLHGLGYATWAAERLRPYLSALGTVWSLDNRGTGQSTRGRGTLSISTLADDAARAIEHIGEPVAVIGYSMGGYIAQLLTHARPDLVEALVLIGTSGGGADAVPVPETTTRAWLAATGSSPEEYARRTMPISLREGWPVQHAGEYERLLRDRLRHPTPIETWREQYAACEAFLRAGCASHDLTVPTLVLHGSADRVVPVGNGRALARAIPQAVYREVPDAGHLLHIEQPALVADEVTQLLDSTPQPAHKGVNYAHH